MESYKICQEASWKVYLAESPESRSIVTNERTGDSVILEGYASDVWNLISTGVQYREIYNYSKNHMLLPHLDSFIDELCGLGVLKTHRSFAVTVPQPISTSVPVYKPSKQYESEMANWVLEHGFLWSAHWELTYRCNEKCVHCLNPVNEIDRNRKHRLSVEPELTEDEARRLINQMDEAGVYELSLSGGESSLRSDFFDIVDIAREKGISISVLTNGLKWSDDEIDRLAERFPRMVSISVYSSDPAKHDAVTKVPGSFNKTLGTILRMRDRGIRVSISSVQMNETIDDLAELQMLGERLGVEIKSDISIVPKLNGDCAPQEHAVLNHKDLVLLALNPESPIAVTGTDAEKSEGKTLFSDPGAPLCKAGKLNITIDPTGFVTPCLLLPKRVGNVRDQHIKKIWESECRSSNVFSDDRSHMRRATVGDLKVCGKRSYCSYCPTCPGKSYMEKGDALGHAPSNCRIAKAREQAAKYLLQGMTRSEALQQVEVDTQY